MHFDLLIADGKIKEVNEKNNQMVIGVTVICPGGKYLQKLAVPFLHSV